MPARLNRPRVPLKPSVEVSDAFSEPLPLPAPERLTDLSWGRVRTVDLGLFLNGRKPVYLGIDQSLTGFGVAAYSPQDKTAYLWLFRPEKRGVQRLLDIQSFLRQIIQQITLRCGEPLHVVMEAYAFSRQMGHALGECGATTKLALIQALGYCKEVAYPTIVAPQQVKKFCTSKGNAKKSEILKACYKTWGVDLPSEDMADAYALARMAACLGGHSAEFKYQQEVIDKLEKHTEWPDSLERDASTARR